MAATQNREATLTPGSARAATPTNTFKAESCTPRIWSQSNLSQTLGSAWHQGWALGESQRLFLLCDTHSRSLLLPGRER